MEFKDKIKKKRNELGLTMEEVAKLVGVTTPTIQRYESGEIKNVRRDKIKLLANALKVTPAYLMDWEESENNQRENLKFDDPQEALRFILKQPSLMAYGGYDFNDMSDQDIIDLANDILLTIRISIQRRLAKKE